MGKKISALILSFLAVVNIVFTTAFSLENKDFETITQTITKENLISKEEDSFPNIMNFGIDGEAKEFTLESTKFEDTVIKNRRGIAKGSIDFPLDSIKPTPPKSNTFDYFDGVLNRNIPVTIRLISLEEREPLNWRDDFYIEVIIENYGSTYYTFAKKDIPHNQEYPFFLGYEDDYLNYLNLDTNSYKILSSSWSSEPYLDGDILKRKAKFYGKRYVSSHTGNYASEVTLPDADGYTVTAVYTLKIPKEKPPIIEEKPIITPEIVEEKQDKLSPVVTTVIAIGVFIGVGVLLFILIKLKKRG